jgi:uncharacterized membrane protein AbrB (regulator of aidB expression)
MSGGDGEMFDLLLIIVLGFIALTVTGITVPYVLMHIGRYVEQPLGRFWGCPVKDEDPVAQFFTGALVIVTFIASIMLCFLIGLLVMSVTTGQPAECLLGVSPCAS